MTLLRGALAFGLLLLFAYSGSTFAATPASEPYVRHPLAQRSGGQTSALQAAAAQGSGNEIGGLSFSDSVDERRPADRR